ncbi:MAG: FtsX-like permease family protein [Clostridiales bacterium]|nr:FtsX-like permease family protein [Clostridiales bacterium]
MRKRQNKAANARTSMSFLTALGLSANNLRTKKGRTLMTAFAGSIGIIGIALILALSSGVNDYIQGIEEDTLAEYPLQITSSAFDISSLLATMSSSSDVEGDVIDAEADAEISVTEVISTLFSQMNSNDLASLKEYIESGESDLLDYVSAIEYIYDLEPEIYLQDCDSIRQVNPDTSMSLSSGTSIFSSFMSTSGITSFYAMPEQTALYESQYDVKAGHWPENYNECVLVLTSDGSISDYMLYTLGLRDYSELENIIEQYSIGENVVGIKNIGAYTYDDVLGITFKVVCSADYYAYDREYDVWVDKTENEAYLAELVENGEELTIVGVVQPSEDASGAALSSGINYPMSLIYHMAELSETSDAVQAQLASPDVNIFTGEEFGEDSDEFDLSSMLSIDEDALADLFDLSGLTDSFELDLSTLDLDVDSLSLDFSSMNLDFSSLNLDIDLSSLDLSSLELDLGLDTGSLNLSGYLDLSTLDLSGVDMSSVEIDLSGLDLGELLSGITLDISQDAVTELTNNLLDGYQTYLENSSGASYSDLAEDFSAYLNSADAADIIEDFLNDLLENSEISVSTDGLTEVIEKVLADAEESGTAVDADALVSAVVDYINESAVVTVSVGDADIAWLVDSLVSGYSSYAEANGLTTFDSVSESFSAYLSTDEAAQILSDGLMSMVDMDAIQEQVAAALEDYLQTALTAALSSYTEVLAAAIEEQLSAAMEQMMEELTEELSTQISAQLSTVMEQMMEELTDELSAQLSTQLSTVVTSMTGEVMEQLSDQLSGSMESLMAEMMDGMSDSLADSLTLDADTLADAFNFNMDSDTLTELLSSISDSAGTDYASNLAALGYADFETPSEIDIYPIDFDAKEEVVAILDHYNDQMEAAGETDKVISYTDLAGTMMSSVTTIINVVSYVLIAFIAVSLVVSCIMISIITQISVMERTKEIGILRAIGASKGNISLVFNAETFIIGSCSGLIGVTVTELLIFPINSLIHSLVEDTSVNAVLPWTYAAMLVVLSIVITVLSGLVPAWRAAKLDPVTALRSE